VTNPKLEIRDPKETAKSKIQTPKSERGTAIGIFALDVCLFPSDF